MWLHSKNLKNSALVGFSTALAFGASSCNDPSFSLFIDGEEGGYVDYRDKVCNPFGGQPGGEKHGLVGTLKYLRDEQPRYTSVADYQRYGQLVTANLFFSQLNVPTRPFDRGFSNQEGQTLLNQHGTTLYEYFSLSLETLLTLPAGSVPGLYQLAVLSDDGSIVSVDEGDGYQTLINNDGTHPTRMGCATRAVDLSQPLKLKVDYYQGPRYHIAMMLLARPWNGSHQDVACGQSGNAKFFDSTVDPPAPTAFYQGLASRGWQVLQPTSYRLPAVVQSNPCHQEPLGTQITRVLPGQTPTNSDTITFEFASNQTQATFFCKLDGATAEPCVSPTSYQNLAQGLHEFKVFAEVSGVRDEVGAEWIWTIDQNEPIIVSAQIDAGTTSLTLMWNTNEPTTGMVNWGVGVDLSQSVQEGGSPSTSHAVTIEGLTELTVYSMQPGGQDMAGNPIPTAGRPVLRSRTLAAP